MRAQQSVLALVIPTAFILSIGAVPRQTFAAHVASRAGPAVVDDASAAPAGVPASSLAVAGDQQNGDQDKQGRVRRPPSGDSGTRQKPDAPRAVPRNDPQSRSGSRDDSARQRTSRQRTEPPHAPPRGNVPHRYFAFPHEYAFPPVDVRLGFYYHPYFGFYYGPYYGPFYPYPGPFPRPTRYSVSSIRLRVRPVETEVYVNGYYAGIVDDFDGVFQRLYLPAGGHHLELRLEGHASYRQDVYVSPGDSLEVRHLMIALAAGARTAPPPEPGSLPPEWARAESYEDEGQPASPYGVLAISTEPADAQIFIDGEAWHSIAGQQEFVMHLPAGWHQLEVRKDDYRPFSTSFESSAGQTTRLSVRLEK